VNKDLQPFVCISEKCTQPPPAFEDFEIWAKHMRDMHSTKWTQQIHKPVIWRCDVYHREEVFAEEETFEEHLNSQHADCSAAERKAISRSSRNPRRRRPNICPLCGYDISAPNFGLTGPLAPKDASPNSTKINESEQLNKLARHIAGHLLRLAFDSSNSLGVGPDNLLNDGGAQHEDTNGSSSVHSLHDSSTDHLTVLSLKVDEAPQSRNLGVAPQVGSYDIEYSDYEPVRSLPEQENLSWVQSWVTWKEERDGVYKESAETDHVIRHFIEAKFTPAMPEELWDRAYDSLRVENTSLVEAYEKLLSRNLPKNDSIPQTPESQENIIEQTNVSARREQMHKLIQEISKKIEREVTTMHVVLSAKRMLDFLVQEVVQAALAYSSVCFDLLVSWP
jgi:hypothetical protein